MIARPIDTIRSLTDENTSSSGSSIKWNRADISFVSCIQLKYGCNKDNEKCDKLKGTAN
jgi:hypothetical protein